MEGFCVKIIGEYISNGDKELIVTRNTIVWLDIELGLSYFVGNFKDRNRYESLFLDLPIVLETKLRSLEYKSADLVQANKGKIEVMHHSDSFFVEFDKNWTVKKFKDKI